MNAPVTAQSLSSLTHLFANPPQYPRNPTHEVHQPLVLYIVRVPGNKDVFLTPLKPATKASISLEAIQSSLYYLHVTTDQDEDVKRSIDEQRESQYSAQVNPPIHRKPLPHAPHLSYPASNRSIPPPQTHPHQLGTVDHGDASENEGHAAGIPYMRSGSEQHGTSVQEISNPGRLDHRLAYNVSSTDTPESLTEPHYAARSQTSYMTQLPHATRPENVGIHQPLFKEIDHTPSFHFGTESSHRLSGDVLTRQHTQFPAITLIRRDPVSGSQWNVGNIIFRGSGLPGSGLGPVSIEITTPGYVRFASAPEPIRTGIAFSDAEAIKAAIHSGRLAGAQAHKEPSLQTFCRVAEYQQYHVNRALRVHHRTDSFDPMAKPPSPTKQLRQVYSFTSPWQGICSFSNGIDGRSVRCRHTLSASALAEEDTSVDVAELRFNLSWGTLTSTVEGPTEGDTLPISQLIRPRPGKDAIKRGFRHFKNMSLDRTSSSQEDYPISHHVSHEIETETDPDRLSLKLGREKAGGGYKGTSAKLGKLIIEDEGLKMCDLVVAACMGVWWQHYESKSS